MNLAALVRRHALRQPDLAALIEGDTIVRYAELDRRVTAAAGHLHALGIVPGDVVACALRSGVTHSVLLLALARAGAVSCSLDWRARPAERHDILERIGAKLLLVDAASAIDGSVATAVVDEAWQRMTPFALALPPPAIDDLAPAMLLLSSGTTGQAKAMTLSTRAVMARAAQQALAFGLQPATRTVNALPNGAASALQSKFAELLVGATAYQIPGLHSAEELLELLQRERIAQVSLPPTTIRQWLALPPTDGLLLPDVVALRAVGAAFHADEKGETMRRVTPNLHEGYGAAASGGIAVATPRDLKIRPDSVGQPLPLVEIAIVGDDGHPLPQGTTGRIRVRSPSAASGYAGDTGRDERHEVFDGDYVFPGDLGRLDADGYLYLEGRATNLIIRGGHNIRPEEIERVLVQHEAVVEAAVTGVPDPVLGEVPVALVVLRSPVAEAALTAWCRVRLAAQKVPVHIHIVKALPQTASGKVQRPALAALLPQRPGR